MITDLLVVVAAIDSDTEGDIDHDAAIETAVEKCGREVSADERDELRAVLNDGWLDE